MTNKKIVFLLLIFKGRRTSAGKLQYLSLAPIAPGGSPGSSGWKF